MLGTVTSITITVKNGDEEKQLEHCDGSGDRMVDSITVTAAITGNNGGAESLEVPAPLAFAEPYAGRRLTGAGVLLSRAAKLSSEDAARLMAEGMFKPEPNASSDGAEDEQRQLFNEEAAEIATTLISGAAAGRRARISLAAARAIKPLVTNERATTVTILTDGTIEVSEQ